MVFSFTANSQHIKHRLRWMRMTSIPALIIATFGHTSLAMKCAAPEDEWRTTKISAAIASRFQSVSRRVSPFEVLERAISMFSTLADKRFAAASKSSTGTCGVFKEEIHNRQSL